MRRSMGRRGLTFVLRNMLLAIGVCTVLQLAQQSLLYAAGYKLALNEEPGLCKEILALSEKGLLKTESLENADKRPASKEISFVEWRSLDNLSEELAARKDSLHSAIFDIDNDGKKDWVVKIDHFLSGLQSEEVVFFRNHIEQPKFQDGVTMEELQRADGSVNFTGAEYPLKRIPKHQFKDGSSTFHSIGGGVFLIPFHHRSNTYVLIANPFQEIFIQGRKFAVIAKFSGELRDICYVEEKISQTK